jgi:hypothetical protein
MTTILPRLRARSLARFFASQGLAAGLGAAYESHRRAVCCYPAPQLPRRQVTPLDFIPSYSGRVLRRDPNSRL